jgi:urease accessory protein
MLSQDDADIKAPEVAMAATLELYDTKRQASLPTVPQKATGSIHLTTSGPSKSKSTFADFSFSYPLRLISPTPHSESPRHRSVYILSHGGGILAGDRILLAVKVSEGCVLSLLTQGSTKIFKTPRMLSNNAIGTLSEKQQHQHPRSTHKDAAQLVVAQVDPSSLLCILPDQVTPFSGASYVQRQKVTLADRSASLVMLDWFTSGRLSRGETWKFDKYESRIKILLNGEIDPVTKTPAIKEIFRDSWCFGDLDNSQTSDIVKTSAANTYSQRTLPYHCFGTLLLVGSRSMNAARAALKDFERVKVAPPTGEVREFIWSVSKLTPPKNYGSVERDDDLYGVVIRAAAMDSSTMRRFVIEMLRPMEEEMGENLFSKQV